MKAVFSICIATMFLWACGSKSADNKSESPAEINTSAERPINPPHGMPGHSCSVPDGAPLPEGTTTQPQIQVNPPVQPEAQNAPVESNQTSSVNPPHGLPGHRCDIAVGAPLPELPGPRM